MRLIDIQMSSFHQLVLAKANSCYNHAKPTSVILFCSQLYNTVVSNDACVDIREKEHAYSWREAEQHIAVHSYAYGSNKMM